MEFETFDKDGIIGKLTYDDMANAIVAETVQKKIEETGMDIILGNLSTLCYVELYNMYMFLYNTYRSTILEINRIVIEDKYSLIFSDDKERFSSIREKRTLGTYYKKEKEIFVNSELVSDMSTLLKHNRYVHPRSSIADVLLHEFAHHVWAYHFSDYLKNKIYTEFRHLIDSNENEFFAENFSSFSLKEELFGFRYRLMNLVKEYSNFEVMTYGH